MSVNITDKVGSGGGEFVAEAASTSRAARRQMLEAMHTLEDALARPAPGREVEWLSSVHGALALMREGLDHCDLVSFADNSLLSEIRAMQPRLEGHIHVIRDEYRSIIRLARMIQDEITDNADERPSISFMRRQLRQLLANLKLHQEHETDLVYEAFQTDLGSGD